MALRDIVTLPEPVLRRKAKKVTEFDQDLQILIDDMVETMRQAPGVGLAAPQVGVGQQVIVVEFGNEDDEDAPKKLWALVNPEIVRVSDETVVGVEGCLSVPGIVGEVERFSAITVKAQNRRGQQMKPIKLNGWVARIFQHEIDHLNGVIFTDRATKVWKPTPEEAAVLKD